MGSKPIRVMDECPCYSVELSCVVDALRRTDPPSKESYIMSKRIHGYTSSFFHGVGFVDGSKRFIVSEVNSESENVRWNNP
jgi:hypothetical protein